MRSFRSIRYEGERCFTEAARTRSRKKTCPPGYKWSMENLRCEPLSSKDDVRANRGGDKDSNPSNGAHYNIWGKTGVNGDGYAYAEPNNWDDAGSVGSMSGGCASCNEENEADTVYMNAAKQTQKKANRHTATGYRRDNKHKGNQSKQMSVHEAMKALKAEAEAEKAKAPKTKIDLSVHSQQAKDFKPTVFQRASRSGNRGTTSPVTRTGNGNQGRSIKDNPLVLRTESKSCVRCGSVKCRCLGNRALIDD